MSEPQNGADLLQLLRVDGPLQNLRSQAADEIERLRELIRQNCNADVVTLAEKR